MWVHLLIFLVDSEKDLIRIELKQSVEPIYLYSVIGQKD